MKVKEEGWKKKSGRYSFFYLFLILLHLLYYTMIEIHVKLRLKK